MQGLQERVVTLDSLQELLGHRLEFRLPVEPVITSQVLVKTAIQG